MLDLTQIEKLYAEMSEKHDLARQKLGRSLTLTEKILFSHLISIDNYSSGSKKNHIKSNRVKYVKGETKDIFQILKKPNKIVSIFHFGEFARIYQRPLSSPCKLQRHHEHR